jgi:hypothetical protein
MARRPSVADSLREEDRAAVEALSPTDRLQHALALGDRAIELLRPAHHPPLSPDEARRRFERQRQIGRRVSVCALAIE